MSISESPALAAEGASVVAVAPPWAVADGVLVRMGRGGANGMD
jgi:hypothetical protein